MKISPRLEYLTMQCNHIVFILIFILIIDGHNIQSCQNFPNHFLVNAFDGNNQTISSLKQCFTIEQCSLIIQTTNQYHRIDFQSNENKQLLFSSNDQLLIDYSQQNTSLIFLSNSNSTQISIKNCLQTKTIFKRQTKEQLQTGIIVTFNSSSFIDYHYEESLEYPFQLSLRFRTIGRISNGVLLSLAHRKSSSLIIPFIIIEHSNGKIEITILQLDERKILSTVTTIQCGKNINNDNWHWLQFEINRSGVFTLLVDDDSRTSQIPSYVVLSWHINALFVGDTRRLSSDLFQPFLGYMSDLIFNNEYLFENLKKQRISSIRLVSQDIVLGYRIAFFNFVTIDTPKSYIAFSERENQNKNHGKLDIYFLFRSYVPDGIILYRYAQGLNEYFAIGLHAGILALFIDFGFGKRQIVSDQSTKLADGKWHEVRITRIGTDKIELIVDNRINRTTLSTNGIRNAVSLQPVLYVGGIPNTNSINLTGSGLNAHGFQGCLASFIVDGRILDYQRALVLNGQVKMNVCSDLSKLCYDFTCIHSGLCSINENEEPICDCTETGYVGERCDKIPQGFYFGKYHSIGLIEYTFTQSRQTEHDTITFGIQTLALSAQIFRLESDFETYFLEYEIVRGRSYIKLNLGDKQSDIYSAVTHLTDGMYHIVKIIRRYSKIEFYVDGMEVKLDGGNKNIRSSEQRMFLAQRRLKIGNLRNNSQWNGIIAGLSLNHQSIFDSLSHVLKSSGDVQEVYPDEQTGLFNLVDSFHIATAIISSTVTTPSSSSLPVLNSTTFQTSTINLTDVYTEMPIMDNLYHQDDMTKLNLIPKLPSQTSFEWFYKYLTHFGIRGLLIGSIFSICFLLFLLFLILHLHCKSRQTKKKLDFQYNQTNGNLTYSQLKPSSMIPSHSSKRKTFLSKYFACFHSNSRKQTSSFRLKQNGSIVRLNSSDSYHLISSIQENHRDKKTSSSYQNSDCILNEHCCIRSNVSPTIYHQMVNNNTESTLRSVKKDFDNSSAQTYSAVYSCDLASNLDIDQDFQAQQRAFPKRRSILKSNSLPNQMKYVYMKNLIDCYAVQSNLLATADENRLQLYDLYSGQFHFQLPVSSVGACQKLFFCFNSRFLIGLFYEISSNVNPYAVKIWSTDDYSIRTNLHPIKCSIAQPSQYSSILYMAGKQKYGRGISLGLLDIDSCSLARELKSDPDTTIGDEIKRIILTKNELYALVACTEYSSTFTCFVIFKLEAPIMNFPDDNPQFIAGSMSNCTMILTRFNCDPKYTFPISDHDQYMLTILRTNEMIIWQLNDGEILFNYDFNYLLTDNDFQTIVDCQIDQNRLMILFEQGLIFIWDITLPIGQFLLIANISDPLIHSISWFDHEHFISIDHDGQRLRTWNIIRKEVLNESLSIHGAIQQLNVHHLNEDVLIGMSMNERSLIMFEYIKQTDSSDQIILC